MRLFEQNNSINHELPELYPRSIPPQVVGPELDSCQGTGRFNQPLVPLLKCQEILEELDDCVELDVVTRYAGDIAAER